MKQLLECVQILRTEAAPKQIRKQIRDLILSGRLPPGTRLPATQELAAAWNTHAPTVQAALAPLVKEGWLTRVPGRGTFVRDRKTTLSCVAVYNATNVWDEPVDFFARAVDRALQRRLHRRGIDIQHLTDQRPMRAQGDVYEPLRVAIERGEVQAVMAYEVNLQRETWLEKLPVPVAYASSFRLPQQVGFDFRQFSEITLEHLARKGCRSVGFLAPLGYRPQDLRPGDTLQAFAGQFLATAQRCGLKTRPEWIGTDFPPDPPAREFERLGYERFHALWRHDHKPEALVVYPDTVARGVVLALHGQQVRVPQRLRLVMHQNAEYPLLCPMPATFVISSALEVAKALIVQIDKQFAGQPCTPILLPFRLEEKQ